MAYNDKPNPITNWLYRYLERNHPDLIPMLGIDAPEEKRDVEASYSDEDLAYMRSLSAAAVQESPRHLMLVISVMALLMFFAIIGMAIAELDITVRGTGKVIPSQQVQLIQSLEGGVVAEILVKEGDIVAQDQPLMKISDIAFTSSYGENQLHYLSLRAKVARLRAEANGVDFEDDPEVARLMPELLEYERNLYNSNKAQLEKTLQVLDEQTEQAESEYNETKSDQKQLKKRVELMRKEIAIKEPLVAKQLVSEVDFLQLQRQAAELEGQYETVTTSLPRIRSKIDESKRKRDEAISSFRNEATKVLNEEAAKASRLSQEQGALEDRVSRTLLRSPVEGTVKRIHINTIGGVVKPGSDLIEVVPSEDHLLIEAKIKPSDIANLHVGQIARIKFTAYDYAIYGSVGGSVSFVSADTITNEKDETYYIVRIRPDQNYLEMDNRLAIKVGMVSEVDILTGKRTVLSYLLKPINRALQNALSER